MKLGKYKIRGISKRFWFILVLLLLLPIIAFAFWPRAEPEPFVITPPVSQLSSFFLDPVSESEKLDPAKPGQDEWYDIGLLDNEKIVAVGSGWDPERYAPDRIQTRVYIPSSTQLEAIRETRPSLVREDAKGLSYYPAFVILPGAPMQPDNREDWVDAFARGEELTPVIQLVSEETLTQGEYDIRGLLYARSGDLQEQTRAEVIAEFPSWIPAVLLAEAERISAAEAERPSERRVELNIPVAYGPYQMVVKSFDWAPPTEMRLCLGISNASTLPIIPVPEIGPSRLYAKINGRDYPLELRSELSELSPGARLETGESPSFAYFVYDASGGDNLPLEPDIEELTIYFPVVAAGGQIRLSYIDVPLDNLDKPGMLDRYRYGGCED